MTPQEKQIDDIITALEKYCIGDINHNRDKPIALFMLSVCCIDLMGALRYNLWNSNKRWDKFVDNYMNEYEPLGLYKMCRNNIIHSYTSNKEYAISYDKNFTVPFDRIGSLLVINPYIFADRVEDAFKQLKIELLDHLSEARMKALEWDEKYPIMRAAVI